MKSNDFSVVKQWICGLGLHLVCLMEYWGSGFGFSSTRACFLVVSKMKRWNRFIMIMHNTFLSPSPGADLAGRLRPLLKLIGCAPPFPQILDPPLKPVSNIKLVGWLVGWLDNSVLQNFLKNLKEKCICLFIYFFCVCVCVCK